MIIIDIENLSRNMHVHYSNLIVHIYWPHLRIVDSSMRIGKQTK